MFTTKGYIRVLKDGYTLSQHRLEREAIEAIVADVEADPTSEAKYEIQHPTVEVDVSRIRRGVLRISIDTIPLVSQTGPGVWDITPYVRNPRNLPWSVTSATGLPAGVTTTETGLLFDGSVAGSSSVARLTITAENKTLRTNFFTCIADVVTQEPPADVISRLWPQPLLAGSVDVTLYPEATGTYTTAFGVPFPRAYLSSVSTVRLMIGGAEIATDVVELCRWRHTSGQYDSVRSVLIYVSRAWTAGTPVTATVEWGTTRTLTLGSGTPDPRTLWHAFVGPATGEGSHTDEYATTYSLTEPKVWHELPATWLSRCMLRSKAQPNAQAGDALWDQYLQGYGRTFALDVDAAVTAGNLPTFDSPGANREAWEYDRPQAFMNVYVMTGDQKWFRHFHRAAEFYRQHLRFTGQLTGETPPLQGFTYALADNRTVADRKYIHAGGTFLQYLFTGDPLCLTHINGIGIIQREMYDYAWEKAVAEAGSRGWTERHWTYYFLGSVYEYLALGSATALARVELMLTTLYTESNATGYGVLLHTFLDHEGANSQALTVSPWMSALLSDALWIWYLHSADTRCLELISNYGRFVGYYGCPQVPTNATSTGAAYSGLYVPWYLASTSGPNLGWSVNYNGTTVALQSIDEIVTSGGIATNGLAEHSMDVACLMQRAVFAQKILGQDSALCASRAASLYQSAKLVMASEFSTSNPSLGRPEYRLRVGNWRRYNAWFGTSTDWQWMLQESIALPTLTANSPSLAEADAPMTFLFTLDAAGSVDVKIPYATRDGTATAGQDYVATSGTAHIPVGATQTTVDVQILEDTAIEGDETLMLVHPGTTDTAVSRAYGIARTPVAIDQTPPRTPVAPVLTVVSSSRIDLTLTDPIDDLKPPSTYASGIASKSIERSTNGTSFTPVGTSTTTSFSATGLSASTQYWFRYSATDAAGNTSAVSPSASATTAAAPSQAATITVRKNGTGNFTTIQAAINAAGLNPPPGGDIIEIQDSGTYNEALVSVRNGTQAQPIVLRAQAGQTPVVTGSANRNLPSGRSFTCNLAMLHQWCDFGQGIEFRGINTGMTGAEPPVNNVIIGANNNIFRGKARYGGHGWLWIDQNATNVQSIGADMAVEGNFVQSAANNGDGIDGQETGATSAVLIEDTYADCGAHQTMSIGFPEILIRRSLLKGDLGPGGFPQFSQRIIACVAPGTAGRRHLEESVLAVSGVEWTGGSAPMFRLTAPHFTIGRQFFLDYRANDAMLSNVYSLNLASTWGVGNIRVAHTTFHQSTAAAFQLTWGNNPSTGPLGPFEFRNCIFSAIGGTYLLDIEYSEQLVGPWQNWLHMLGCGFQSANYRIRLNNNSAGAADIDDTIANMMANFPANFSGVTGSPNYVSTTIPTTTVPATAWTQANANFTPQAAAYLGAAVPLTTVSTGGTNVSTVTLADARWFRGAMFGRAGHTITFAGAGTREISSITGNAVTLTTPITVAGGVGVYLGSSATPRIGAVL